MESESFEQIVERYYQPLYRFALSLTRSEAEAADLTQETFCTWATRGHQLRERAKVKSWLFTTLYREFVRSHRRSARFPHYEIEMTEHELPPVLPVQVEALDGQSVLAALLKVDELYRATLMLFYLEDHSYREIAEILDVPIGTVMSRLSRGKEQLRHLLADTVSGQERKIVPMNEPRRASGNQP